MQSYLNIIACVCLLILAGFGIVLGAEIEDPAIAHYVNKADSVLKSSPLFNKNVQYSVSLTSIYNNISYRGIIAESDTAEFLVNYKDGRFNLSEIIDSAGIEQNIFPANIQFEMPWNFNCRFYFFPRDTGAGELAVGFAPVDTLDRKTPEGMIIIDRDTYQITDVYLHYLWLDDYEWLSHAYEFSYENKTMLLRSLTLQGCYYGFFERRFFKQELIFNNYEFQ